MIELNDSLFIAKGGERECYIHPNDSSKLIKIQYLNNINRNQNDLDIYYYKYLNTLDISYSNIPKLYNTVDTNKGNGLVFDLIKDYNNKLSISFEDIINNKKLSTKQEAQLLSELKQYLIDNNIVFGDVVLSNILCQEVKKEYYKLIIVDGLGARRFGFKLWLHINSKLFTKYRITKQWNKLIFNYNTYVASLK